MKERFVRQGFWFRQQKYQRLTSAMNPKAFIPILLFLFLALSGSSALCETSKEQTRDDYTRLVNQINEYNATMMNVWQDANLRLINKNYDSNFKLLIVLYGLSIIYTTFALGYSRKIIFKQQRQIDDLKRELEEMKKC